MDQPRSKEESHLASLDDLNLDPLRGLLPYHAQPDRLTAWGEELDLHLDSKQADVDQFHGCGAVGLLLVPADEGRRAVGGISRRGTPVVVTGIAGHREVSPLARSRD